MSNDVKTEEIQEKLLLFCVERSSFASDLSDCTRRRFYQNKTFLANKFVATNCAVGMKQNLLFIVVIGFCSFFTKTSGKYSSNGLESIFRLINARNIVESRLVMQFLIFLHSDLARKVILEDKK